VGDAREASRLIRPYPARPSQEDVVFVGTLELDVLLGDTRSLKQKRAVVRPVLTDLRRQFDVAVAEVGHQDLLRRALLGVAVVSDEASHCTEVLDSCERLVAARPELDLLSAHRTLRDSDDQ
jgi:uncharacterized protein YlxP (DUF503 family)